MSDKIAIGFHSFGTCTTSFCVSLSGAMRYEGNRVSNLIHVPSPYVTEARNKIVWQFLNKTKANYLMMLDVDIEFFEDAISQTYAAAKHVGSDIMFGCYALGDFRSSIFAPPAPGTQLPTLAPNLEHGKVYNIYAGATGWLLMTRKAAEKIAEVNAGRHWKWFDHDIEDAGELRGELYKPENNTIRIGEDFSFCKRARDAGLSLYGTTLPILLHDKYQPLLPDFQSEAAQRAGLKTRNATKQETESLNANRQLTIREGLLPSCGEAQSQESGSPEKTESL